MSNEYDLKRIKKDENHKIHNHIDSGCVWRRSAPRSRRAGGSRSAGCGESMRSHERALHQDLSEIIELKNKIYDEKLELIESNTKKDNLKDGWNAHGWCAIALPHPPQVPLALVREIVPAHRT